MVIEREGKRDDKGLRRGRTQREEKTSVPQMFIRIFITLELKRERLSDS